MSRLAVACLFLAGLLPAMAVAAFQPAPGYMDADYYFTAGQQLALGRGFQEPFLWNYLDDPAGLPHPAHRYWMPGASLLAALGMRAYGAAVFGAARLGFLLLAGFLPPLTAGLAYRLSGQKRHAWLAGMLAAFPGFYLPFLGTTDTFGLYMVLGLLFLGVSGVRCQVSSEACLSFKVFKWELGRGAPAIRRYLWCGAMGVVAGLMHLARADGILWLSLAALTCVFLGSPAQPGRDTRSPRSAPRPPAGLVSAVQSLRSFFRRGAGSPPIFYHFISISILLLGYLLVMSPWLARNLGQTGALFAPGSGRALWISHYDELYLYPAELLTPARWWSAGLGEILRARLWALGQNLQTVLAVQLEIFLVPLALAGLWRTRADGRVQSGLLAWGFTFLVMTVVFPFQGARGGLFHSGAAIQPLFWAVTPAGLDALAAWGARRRGWQPDRAYRLFGGGAVALAFLLTAIASYQAVIGADPGRPAWGAGEADYARLEEVLQSSGAPPSATVMVNNPPGYWAASGRPALAVPDGGIEATLAVARRYGAAYLWLELNHPHGLDDLYQNPGDRPGLDYRMTLNGTHLFAVTGE